ncbi:substrate-binding periplasmic protein [Chitinimonas sp. PSY-7]|uniref:substrate-binding periplasmic protein n=1 Tax=Chitinimonas sp. PSY-7 TaxID=3459088 RepID=UPI0040400A7D
MKCPLVCLSLLLNLSVQAAGIAEPPTVPLLISEERDAKGYVLPVGPKRRKLIELIGTKAGLKFDIKTYPLRRAQKLTERGEGLLWGIVQTPKRSRHLVFSKPIAEMRAWMVVPAGKAFAYDGINGLSGKTLSISTGGQYGELFETYRDRLFKVEEEAGSYEARFAMMAQGRVDMILVCSLYTTVSGFQAWLERNYGGIGEWSVLPRPLSTETLHIAAARNHAINRFLPVIDRAIVSLNRDGAIHAITHARPLYRRKSSRSGY